MKNPFLIACLLFSASLTDAQTALPSNMYGDTAFAPFYWGVASGDPTPDGVVIWTKVAGIPEAVIQTQTWEVATDSLFTNVVESGTVDAFANNDLCVRVEVENLQSNTYYHYRFTDSESGQTSQVGRTKTAPTGGVDQFTLAVASCSSIYSGFFNAYRQMANNEEVDLVVHLGDYIYDFVDQDEEVRIPDPYPTQPDDLQSWRDRHAYYLLDPDLRLARQMHPWVVIWDNHDFGDGTEGGAQAFWEYVPRRDYHNDIERVHRSYNYGDLFDLIMIDIEKFRNIDEVAPGEPSVLTNDQRDWFLNQLENSDAKWRIVGNQKMFGGWYSEGIPQWLPIPNSGDVFDDGSWDGFMAERDTVLSFIQENAIDNVMVVSGDVHMSFCMDLSRDPRNSAVYDPQTGDGSLGVEFIPTSVSRGNFDESGVAAPIAEIAQEFSGGINPHHRFTNFIDHGYGLLHVTQDSIVAEIRYCDILNLTDNESLATRQLMLDGQNRWYRPGSSPNSILENAKTADLLLYPNPTSGQLHLRYPNISLKEAEIRLFDLTGRMVHTEAVLSRESSVDVSRFRNGAYLLELVTKEKAFKKSFVISR